MKKINPESLIKKLIPIIYKAGAISIKYSKKIHGWLLKTKTRQKNG